MKILTVLAAYIPSAIAAGTAAYLAAYSIDGWGWFLFGTVVLYPSIKIKDGKEDRK